ncbi:uncharacterized protein LOC124458001 [Xenia sp. Carnegie-2017]|uniref:uncharacterized protein LOC124458001 n=1 Tax=Xenia sp. Carnegie-2017 TaxID=2897299 RepID=UPI001F0426DF|nr:uncharacterized protein LOC124458001 [Xenia sp. Carnegie-2017]
MNWSYKFDELESYCRRQIVRKFSAIMYSAIYGCYSNSKNNSDNSIHFFTFPNGVKNTDEKKREKIWIEFCKRKGYKPTKNSTTCSLHFENDAYIPSCSPSFLNSINFSGKKKAMLKGDAIPTLNKSTTASEAEKLTAKSRCTGSHSRRKDIDAMVGEYIENKCAPVEEEIVNADACSPRGEVIFHENSD